MMHVDPCSTPTPTPTPPTSDRHDDGFAASATLKHRVATPVQGTSVQDTAVIEIAKAPAQPPAQPAVSKILFLDGLRGLAAMMVVVQHAHYMNISIGQPAVDTFFVLSAFLLTMIFEKKARTLMKEQASPKRWGWALLDYFVRRFLRVYPLFAIVAIGISFYSPQEREKIYHVHHSRDYNLFHVLTFEFSSRYHVFWTLPLEITYYFIIPVFVVLLLAMKRWWWIPMLPLAYLVTYSGLFWLRIDHQGLVSHLPTFLCGSMAAMIYAKTDQWVKRRAFVFKRGHRIVIRTLEYATLFMLISLLYNGLFFTWVMKNPVPQGKGGHFVSGHISFIIVCEMLIPGPISAVLEWALLRYAGKISFSMYLLHSFVIYQDWVQDLDYWDQFFTNWGLTFFISAVSYHLIEYPCQVLAGRIGLVIKKRDAQEQGHLAPVLPVHNDKK